MEKRISIVKKVIALVAVLAMALALSACATSQKSSASASSSEKAESASSSEKAAVSIVDWPIIQDTDFGSVYIDMTTDEFNAVGFQFGDSVDVVFSNGYELRGIPYYNGYYTNVGDPLIVGYPGYPHVAIALNYGKLWDEAGLSANDTVTVTLAGKGAYAAQQNALDIKYTDERSDYSSDVVFANFRALTGGKLRSDIAYRSASPVDNEHNRAPYVEELMKQAGVAYDLDLSDRAEEVDAFMAEDKEQGVDVSYFAGLREAGLVGLLDLSASYPSQDFAQTLAAGLVEMSKHDGPYLIHCIEGKDRTGFVCILLEALAGATYDEMQNDYMITYANYYGVTKEGDPEKYATISDLYFDGMLSYLANADEGADLRAIDYSGPAREYLQKGGMTSEQLDALVARLCG